MNVVYQPNGLPQCPVCEKPTTMSPDAFSTSTAACYPPRIAPDGTNLNPDRNTITKGYSCCDCQCYFLTHGNHHDGFLYGNIKLNEPQQDHGTKAIITFNGISIGTSTNGDLSPLKIAVEQASDEMEDEIQKDISDAIKKTINDDHNP